MDVEILHTTGHPLQLPTQEFRVRVHGGTHNTALLSTLPSRSFSQVRRTRPSRRPAGVQNRFPPPLAKIRTEHPVPVVRFPREPLILFRSFKRQSNRLVDTCTSRKALLRLLFWGKGGRLTDERKNQLGGHPSWQKLG